MYNWGLGCQFYMKADVTHSSKSIFRIPTSLIFIEELVLNSIFFTEIDVIFYLSGDVRSSLLSVNVAEMLLISCPTVYISLLNTPECHHPICCQNKYV